MPETDLRAVAFDLDGVILDSERIYDELFSKWMRDHDLTCDEDYLESLFGLTWQEVFIDVNKRYSTDIDVATSFTEMSEAIVNHIVDVGVPLKEGAANAIEQLNQRYVLAVVSSSPRNVIERALKHHGLYAYFNQIIGSEDVTYHKPHPEPYLKALTALRVTPEEAIVIEDSFTGAQAGAASGAFVYAMPDKRLPDEKFTSFAKVVHSFDEVLADLL